MSKKSQRSLACAVVALATALIAAPASATVVVAPGDSIQNAIAAAAPGETVQLLAGVHTGNVVIDKAITLEGAGQGLTTLTPATSGPTCLAGGGSICAGGSNVILVQADGVTIRDLTIDGQMAGSLSSVVTNGAHIDARNGIITDHTTGNWTGLTVTDTTVRNIYLRGIYASTGGSFSFTHDTVDNVASNPASIGMFTFGGTGTMADNVVSRTNDALSANHSRGTSFERNVVTQSASAIHTDNAGDGGGTADVISDNTVSDCADGYGIWVFVPYIAPTVSGNTITGCIVGLSSWGNGGAGQVTFSNNTVDGTGADAGSVGAYVTTDEAGLGGSDDNSLLLTGNTIRNFDYGVATQNTGGKTATLTARLNRLAADTVQADQTGGGTLDAAHNWWGANSGASATAGTVDASSPLQLAATRTLGSVQPGQSSAVTVQMLDGASPASGFPTTPVALLDSGSLGSFAPASATLASGAGSSTWTAGAGTGSTTLRAQLDSQTVDAGAVTVSNAISDATSEVAAPSDTVSTGNTASTADPVAASVTLPADSAGGIVTIQEESPAQATTDGAPAVNSGYDILGTVVHIDAPPATSTSSPLVFSFVAHAPGVPAGEVKVFRNGGAPLGDCASTTLSFSGPLACVQSVVADSPGAGDFTITVHTLHASFWSVGASEPTVVFDSAPSIVHTSTPTFTYHAEIGGTPVAADFECQVAPLADVPCGSSTLSGSYSPNLAVQPDGGYTLQVQANVGGIAGPLAPHAFTMDRTDPTVTITVPRDGGRYPINKPVNAAWTCVDPNGTVVSHTATVEPGSPIPRSASPATKTFTVSCTDNAGNVTTKAVTYKVFTFDDLVRDDHPIGYWRLDDGVGSSVMSEASGNGHTGEYKNGQNSGPVGISGDLDHARAFFGDGGYGYVNDLAAPSGFHYSMEAFVYLDRLDDATIVQQGGSGSLLVSGGKFAFREVDTNIGGGPVLATNTWYHVAGTWDGFTARLYVNGQPVASGPAKTRPSGISTLYIGYGDAAPWLKGAIDEVSYYDTTLSATAINEHYLADPPPPLSEADARLFAGAQPAPAAPSAQPGAVKKVAAAGKPAAGHKAKAKPKVSAKTKKHSAGHKAHKRAPRHAKHHAAHTTRRHS